MEILTEPETRFCPKCKDNLAVDNFKKKRSGRFESYCIQCTKQYKREQYAKDPAKIIARSKKYTDANKEKVKDYQDRYRNEHREELNQEAKEYRKDNSEEIKEREHARNKSDKRKAWKADYYKQIRERYWNDPEYKERILELSREGHKRFYEKHRDELLQKWHENKDVILEKRRKKYVEDPEYRTRVKSSIRNWAKNHPEARKAIKQRRRSKEYQNGGNLSADDIINLLFLQENKCKWCSKELDNSYHLDHVIPVSKGGASTIFNIVASCPDCNQSKSDKLPYTEWIPPNKR